ncbi:Serine/threonine kinase mps1 [Marasmius tenuissimus]|nr:Serine/threonine kinase mps1 [Marasmius tenuissimus]
MSSSTPPPSSPIPSSSPQMSPASPAGSDDSYIEQLSFTYVDDGEGNIVRLPRDSGPSPPSATDAPERGDGRRSTAGENQDQSPIEPGNVGVRFAKGSGTSPPISAIESKPDHPKLDFPPRASHSLQQYNESNTNPISPVPRRSSLSRSESAYPVLNGPQTATSERDRERVPRSFQRVASGPALSGVTSGASTAASILPGRVRVAADVQSRAQQKKNAEELRAKLLSTDYYGTYSHVEEKENMRGSDEIPSVGELYGSRQSVPSGVSTANGGPQLTRLAPPSRSYGSHPSSGTSYPLSQAPVNSSTSRTSGSRLLKGSSSKYAADRVNDFGAMTESENEDGTHRDSGYGSVSGPNGHYDSKGDTDIDEYEPPPQSARSLQGGVISLNSSSNNRPRRSASLSESRNQEEPPPPSHRPPQAGRPGTSLGLRREAPVIPSRREEPEPNYEHDYQQSRQTPSPTHPAATRAAPARPVYSHKRRDSDTLRSVPHPQSTPGTSTYSPTIVDNGLPPGLSPSARGVRTSSSGPNGLSVKHRRSPTAPEPPTTSGNLKAGTSSSTSGKTWANGDRNSGEQYYEQPPAPPQPEREVKREREQRVSRQMPSKSTSMSVSQMQPQSTKGHHIAVNKKVYARLDMVGKGGSSRVYRVMDGDSNIFAIKRVSLENSDAETLQGYMNEIALLNRLAGNSKIIRLIDSEVKLGTGNTKGHLFLVMECGEIDLARLLQERVSQPLNLLWVGYYWQQMLEAVQVIHDEKIVHSDLKPANFVVVKGNLKLIDFGIANAIANDTTNIHREHQIGTVNYMSPEAIEFPDGMARLKVGRSSDVWSLGCILYQMVYGLPPFNHLTVYQKMRAIPDPSHVIEYPEYSVPVQPVPKDASPSAKPQKLYHLKQKVRRDVIADIQSCLCRSSKERMTIPELLKQDWLSMEEKVTPPPPSKWDLIKDGETIIDSHYMKQLLAYGIKLGETGRVSDDPAHLEMEAARLVSELRSICKGTT